MSPLDFLPLVEMIQVVCRSIQEQSAKLISIGLTLCNRILGGASQELVMSSNPMIAAISHSRFVENELSEGGVA